MFAQKVTPFVGVWIETAWALLTLACCKSHPSWVCGLKQLLDNETSLLSASHPSWVCGLKLAIINGKCASASHTLRGCVD